MEILLFNCVDNNCLEAVILILNYDKELIHHRYEDGENLLMIAAHNKFIEMTKLLLKYGHVISENDDVCATPHGWMNDIHETQDQINEIHNVYPHCDIKESETFKILLDHGYINRR